MTRTRSMGGIYKCSQATSVKYASKSKSTIIPEKESNLINNASGNGHQAKDLDLLPKEEISRSVIPNPPTNLHSNSTMTDVNSKIEELSGIISTLCGRILSLEATVRELSQKADQTEPASSSKQVSRDAFTQTSTQDMLCSYADALKQSSYKQEKPFLTKVSSCKKKIIDSKEESEKKKKKTNVTQTTRNDVTKANDVKPSSAHHECTHHTNKQHQDLSECAIIQDSVMNGVDRRRLGRSYGITAFTNKCYTTDKIEDAVQSTCSRLSQPPDAILIHCGINDLKTTDAPKASKSLLASVNNIARDYPKLKQRSSSAKQHQLQMLI